MKYVCAVCETEFVVEGQAERCLKCGSLDISLADGPEASPVVSGEAEDGKEDLPAVREVLRKLCIGAYDSSFQGSAWEGLIDEALEELRPFMRGKEVTA